MIKPLLLALAILLLIPNLPGIHLNAGTALYDGKEKFSPNLTFINSLDKLEKFVDAAATHKNIPFHSLEYAELLDNSIAFRFYEGSSHKTLQQDWIAVVIDKLFGTNLSDLSSADEIMLHPHAAAGQQNIIMMEILKRKNIDFRSISIHKNTALEINVGNGWYFFDVSHEPSIKADERIMGDFTLLAAYDDGTNIPAIERSYINNIPINYIIPLQFFTAFFSKTAWIFALGMVWVFRKRSYKMYAIKARGKYKEMYPLQPVFNA